MWASADKRAVGASTEWPTGWTTPRGGTPLLSNIKQRFPDNLPTDGSAAVLIKRRVATDVLIREERVDRVQSFRF